MKKSKKKKKKSISKTQLANLENCKKRIEKASLFTNTKHVLSNEEKRERLRNARLSLAE